jgi:hypothetical protein
MSLTITRDADGRVTITDPSTGKSETILTTTAGKPAAAVLKPADELPSFQWDQRRTAA